MGIFLNGCLFSTGFKMYHQRSRRKKRFLFSLQPCISNSIIYGSLYDAGGCWLVLSYYPFYRLCVWHGWGAFFSLFKYGREALFAQSVCVTTLSPNYPQELFEASCLIFLLQ